MAEISATLYISSGVLIVLAQIDQSPAGSVIGVLMLAASLGFAIAAAKEPE